MGEGGVTWSNSLSLTDVEIRIVYHLTIEKIRENIGDSYFWASADETTDHCGRYIANIVVGRLDSTRPSSPHLIASRVLEVANSSTIARVVRDSLRNTVVSDLASVKSYFSNLPGVIVSLEATHLPLIESVKIMHTIQEGVKQTPGPVASSVATKLEQVLQRNPGNPGTMPSQAEFQHCVSDQNEGREKTDNRVAMQGVESKMMTSSALNGKEGMKKSPQVPSSDFLWVVRKISPQVPSSDFLWVVRKISPQVPGSDFLWVVRKISPQVPGSDFLWVDFMLVSGLKQGDHQRKVFLQTDSITSDGLVRNNLDGKDEEHISRFNRGGYDKYVDDTSYDHRTDSYNKECCLRKATITLNGSSSRSADDHNDKKPSLDLEDCCDPVLARLPEDGINYGNKSTFKPKMKTKIVSKEEPTYRQYSEDEIIIKLATSSGRVLAEPGKGSQNGQRNEMEDATSFKEQFPFGFRLDVLGGVLFSVWSVKLLFQHGTVLLVGVPSSLPCVSVGGVHFLLWGL
uniref:Uncharacterized protein n=1 Tax=Timema monikensis TaxID=170555 RepID=A0A7R9EHN5_9NEOP|nr:unnamed protein product [Timema monikensis]